jgi:molybdopterin converting factor small subunit
VKVRIPTPLRSYTGQQSVVELEADDLTEVFTELDQRFPGIRFRVLDERSQIRKHMKVFVNDESILYLSTMLAPTDEVTFMKAL